MPFATHATLRQARRPHSSPVESTSPPRAVSPSAGSASALHEGRFKRLLGRKGQEELDFGCAGDETPEQGGWAAYSMADKPSQHARSSSSLTSTSTSSSALPALVHSRAHSSNSSHSSSSHSRTHSNSSTFSFNHSRDHSGSSTYSSCASASSLPPSPTLSSDPFSSTAGSVSSSPKKTQRRSEEVCPLDGLNAYFWAVRLSRVEEDTASRSASSSPRQSSPQSSPLPSEPRQFVPQSSPHSSPQHSLPRRTSTFNHSRRRDPTPVEFDFEIAYTPTGSSTFTPLSIPTSPSSAHSGESTLSVHSPTFPSEDLDTELEELSEYFSHPAPRNQVFPSWPHKETAGALRVGEQRRVVDSGRNALRERRVEYDWI